MPDETPQAEVSPGGSEAAPVITTFDEAFAADVSPASEPSTDSQPEASPATAQPGDPTADSRQTSPEGTGDRSPYIPRARFDEVNTERNEYKAWKESHAWADKVDPTEFKHVVGFYARAQVDPRGHAFGIIQELAAHPEHGPAVRSELARLLGSRPGKVDAPPDSMPPPDISVTDGMGNEVSRTYSHEQMLKRDEFLKQQWRAEVQSELAPIKQSFAQTQAERQQLRAQAEANTFGQSFASELATLPLFNEHKAAIAEKLKGMKLASDHPDAVKAAAYKAYFEVVRPKLTGQRSESEVVANLQRKARASSSVNPGNGGSAGPRTYTSFADIPREDW